MEESSLKRDNLARVPQPPSTGVFQGKRWLKRNHKSLAFSSINRFGTADSARVTAHSGICQFSISAASALADSLGHSAGIGRIWPSSSL
ncbi:hypothetical protein HBA55_05895 [Pseudomaricurvus alkylphenolicus]|uniref:hypothetical protein n=1 Tax=Pseudomaricurvus alkylphenolicus TaxID=1306991 RepID=UPI0014227A61|nr:hypothetical protein [Pseudomaricurvus alkylphenolicus]NIB39107.1 hypothetical protein [Pseudomaricurvus alkylphenolicus]